MSLPASVRRCRRGAPRTRALAVLSALAFPALARAQSMDDGLTESKGVLRTGVEVTRDRWSRYWEGTLERSNANVGTVTTTSVTWSAVYGLTRSLNLHASLPYVATRASEGVLHGMRGAQDVNVGAKWRVLRTTVGARQVLGVTVLGAVGMPTTDYTVDFLPMSIGMGARTGTLRGALHLKDRSNLFADATLGRTWRSTVHLDRPAYYTDGGLVLSDEVRMPDVSTWTAGVGYNDRTWCIPLMLMGQRTLGGGDIRRQDMPFVSNRMDFTKVAGKVLYTLPGASSLIVEVGGATTLRGRNVGRSTALTAGVISSFRPF